MSEHESGPLEVGADMDYAAHDRTYHGFLNAAKYGVLIIVALLVAMAAGFFTAAGFFSSTILFFILLAVGVVIMR